MSEPPERPAQPGVETHLAKDVVADVQAALDATFNAVASAGRDGVEARLRTELDQRGVAGQVPDAWVADAAASMAAGEPVVAEPGDA